MVETKVITIPESKDDKDVSFKYGKVLEDRNKAFAKMFRIDPLDVTLKLHMSRGVLVSSLGPNGDPMGIFAGYKDGDDCINVVHPAGVEGLFPNIDKQMLILIDYCLVKFYLCKKYFPNEHDFKMYYKYVSDVLAGIVSGDYREESVKFDLRMYDDEKRFKKDQELGMIFYLMMQNSGVDFIFEHLDKIMADCDIRKTIFTIYKKTFSELVKVGQKEALDEKRKIEELEKAKRAASRDKNRNSNSQ